MRVDFNAGTGEFTQDGAHGDDSIRELSQFITAVFAHQEVDDGIPDSGDADTAVSSSDVVHRRRVELDSGTGTVIGGPIEQSGTLCSVPQPLAGLNESLCWHDLANNAGYRIFTVFNELDADVSVRQVYALYEPAYLAFEN